MSVAMETIRESDDVTADKVSRRHDVSDEAEDRSLLRREYVPSQFDDTRSEESPLRGGGASRTGGAGSRADGGGSTVGRGGSSVGGGGSSVGGEVVEREIVIIDEKLKWNAKSKIGSLQNTTHKPGGGSRKIVNEKLKWEGKKPFKSTLNYCSITHPISPRGRQEDLAWVSEFQ